MYVCLSVRSSFQNMFNIDCCFISTVYLRYNWLFSVKYQVTHSFAFRYASLRVQGQAYWKWDIIDLNAFLATVIPIALFFSQKLSNRLGRSSPPSPQLYCKKPHNATSEVWWLCHNYKGCTKRYEGSHYQNTAQLPKIVSLKDFLDTLYK